jgi:hypothetical protein
MDKEKRCVNIDFPAGDKIVVVINGNEPIEGIQEKIEQAIYSKLYGKNPEITNYDLAIKMLREIAQDSNIGAEWRIEACNILKDACEL